MRNIWIFSALIMLAFAGMQTNDPDPLLWSVIYLIPAALCAMRLRDVRLIYLSSCLAGFYVTLAYWLWPDSYAGLGVMSEGIPGVEHAREALGLCVAAVILLSLLHEEKMLS